VVGQDAVRVVWNAGKAVLTLDANLSPRVFAGFAPAPGDVLWSEGEAGADGVFGPWTVRWTLSEAR
jgi:hypothetical protein